MGRYIPLEGQAYVEVTGSSVLFILWHVKLSLLVTDGTTGLDVFYVVKLVICSALACYIYERSNNLALCIVFHGGSNAFAVSAPLFGFLMEMWDHKVKIC